MVIKIGENPEHDPELNKFLDHISHEGHRGKIIMISKNGKEAVIKSLTDGFEGIVKVDKMYLIRETNEKQYPETVKEVNEKEVKEMRLQNV